MATEPAALRRAIDARHAEFVRHLNTGDVDRLVATYYAADAHLLPPHRPMVQGADQIRAAFRSMLEAGPFEIASLETAVVDGAEDMAVAIGTYRSTIRPPAGEPIRDTGKYFEEWRRQADGSWRCVADMWNSDLAAN